MLIRERDVRPTRVGRDQSDPLFATSWDTSPFAPRCGIEFVLGRSATGQRLASSRRPLRWPFTRPPTNARRGTALAEIRPVSPLCRRDPTAQQPARGDPQCRCARGSDPLFGRKSCPNSLSVSAPYGVAPLDCHCSAGSRGPSQGRDREGTTSSFGDVPLHARRAVPSHLPFRQQDRPCSAFGLRVDSRGGSDAPMRSKTSTEARPTFVRAGTSLPPRSNPYLENGPARRAWSRPEFEERQPMLRNCDCARCDPRSNGRARPRQGSARFARRGHHREPRP
jgi:hypothetical protein